MLMNTAEYANKLSKWSERVKSMHHFLDLLSKHTQILDIYSSSVAEHCNEANIAIK